MGRARTVTGSRAAAFRLRRHHLAGGKRADATTVSQDVCGIQAQVMSAAELALWARNHALTRDDIQAALWKDRTLVKTSLMRGTLHLVSAADFPMYITALRTSRLHSMRQIMGRYGVTAREADAVTEAVVDALGAGPMTRSELTRRAGSLPILGRKAKAWFKDGWWGVVRQAIVEGAICYGPDRDRGVTLVRVDQWLGKRKGQKKLSEQEALSALLRRYLGAYGPATLRDFARWAGMSGPSARATWEAMAGELVAVTVDGEEGFLLREDYDTFARSRAGAGELRLLPYFDPFMLGHLTKDHLVEERHYKRVYRKAGWISPVVLLNGKVLGTWSYTRKARSVLVEVEPFARLAKKARADVEKEAEALGAFFGMPVEVRWG